MVLLDECRMDTARFTYLLFDKIVPVAKYLEIVLHFSINGDNSFAYLHLRQACGHVNLRILIKLIKYKSLFLNGTLIDTEEQILCHLGVVHNLSVHGQGCLVFNFTVIAHLFWLLYRGLVNNNHDLTENEWA